MGAILIEYGGVEAACFSELPEKPKRQNGDVAGPTKCDPGRSTKHLCFTPLGHHAASVFFDENPCGTVDG